MKLFILMMILSASLSQFQLLGKLAPYASSLQKSCVDYSPQFSLHIESMNALVCGSSVKNLLIKDLFINSELYHLLIVSGSHLQTLLWLLNKRDKADRRKRFFLNLLKWLLLVSYSLMTGFGAPVVRALVAEGLRSLSRYYRWNWSAWRVQLASGFFLLALCPDYFNSISFYLSWLASLGFLIPLPKNQSGLLKHFIICLVISLLLLIPFSYQGPLGFLMNFLLGGVLSLLLFPLAIITKLAFVCGLEIHCLFDQLFAGLLKILAIAQELGLSETRPRRFPEMGWRLWAALLSVQIGLFYWRANAQRIPR